MVTTLFIDFSDAQGQLTPKSVMEFCLNSNSSKLFIYGLVTSKNEEDPSKNEGTRVVHNISPIISLDSQGQLTHKSLVISCQISNPSEILSLSLSPARIKNNQSKIKELESHRTTGCLDDRLLTMMTDRGFYVP